MFCGKDLVSLSLIAVLVSMVQVADSIDCPAGQVSHLNGTVCCIPVFNCDKNHQIIGCTGADNNADQCVPCGNGEINNHVTSSVDDSWTKFRCFTGNTPAQNDCPLEDTLPFSQPRNNCGLSCECDIYKCYYGNPCGCVRAKSCGIGEELNAQTGDCEPCKNHTYKDVSGCEPCTWNETSWRLSHATGKLPVEEVRPVMIANVDEVKVASTPMTTDGTSKYVIAAGPKESVTSESNKEGESDNGGVPVVPIVVIILLLVVGAVTVAFILYVKRKINKGDESSRLVIVYNKLSCKRGNQPLTEADVEEGEVVQENGNAVGNERPQQFVEPMVQEKAAENVENEMPLNELGNAQNESTAPLIRSESNGDCDQDSTETKST